MIFLVKVTRTTTISKNSLIRKIPAEIQRQGLRKADDNCQHFTSFNAANAGPSRNNTGKNPAKNFGLFLNEEILVNINT